MTTNHVTLFKVCYNNFMQTLILGILILISGYVFYSKYINNLFSPDDRETPATKLLSSIISSVPFVRP